MKDLPFTHNWNKKLNCDSFSTIRLHNPGKYTVGAKLSVTEKGVTRPHPVRVCYVKTIYLHQLTEAMTRLDMGVSLAEGRKVIEKMYGGKVPNLPQARFDFVVLAWIKSESLSRQEALFDEQKMN